MTQFDAGSLKRRLRTAGASEPLADAIGDGVREAVSPLATREDIHAALHAQTRWLVMFGLALAAIIIAAVGGLVAALV